MLIAVLHRLLFVAILSGPDATAVAPSEAGRDSFEYRLDIGRDELRGPAPARTPSQIKAEIRPLLLGLRADGKGLKAATEANIESFLTVADAFEADGRLATACDVLTNLAEDLEALRGAGGEAAAEEPGRLGGRRPPLSRCAQRPRHHRSLPGGWPAIRAGLSLAEVEGGHDGRQFAPALRA